MEWVWNSTEESIGKYRLNNELDKLDKSLVVLHRYDYEDWDTYEISDANGSMLFVKNDIVRAIQCAYACYTKSTNIIGLNYLEASNLLNISADKWEDVLGVIGVRVLIDDTKKLRMYAVDNKIKFVIIHSW